MNQKNLILVILLIIIVASAGATFLNTDNGGGETVVIMKEINYGRRAKVGGIDIALKDNDMSRILAILDGASPVLFSSEKVDWITPKYYTVIPLSRYVSVKEIIWEDENIDINALKNEDGDIYASFESCFGKNDYNITELQDHLDKYSLEVKEVNWIYVSFERHVQYKEIEYTLDLLKEENNVIRIFPDVADG